MPVRAFCSRRVSHREGGAARERRSSSHLDEDGPEEEEDDNVAAAVDESERLAGSWSCGGAADRAACQ